MKTGRDVVIGALLGADEFGFATAPCGGRMHHDEKMSFEYMPCWRCDSRP